MFPSPLEHLHAELDRLDLLIHREILRLRAAYQLSLDEFRGLYISDEQVDQLIGASQPGAEAPEKAVPERMVAELTWRADRMRLENNARSRPEFPWNRLAQRFGLSALEQDTLLLAIAPELRRKYEALYAYLNNDVTRPLPTGDLAARLLGSGPADLPGLRAALLPGAPLSRNGLLEMIPGSAEHSAWLSDGFRAAPAVVQFLLGLPPEDSRTAGWSSIEPAPALDRLLELAPDFRLRLERLPALFQDGSGPLLVLEGAPGAGRWAAARAVCSRLERPIVRVDLAAISGASPEWAARVAALQTRLCGAALYLEHAELLFGFEAGAASRMAGERAWLEQAIGLDGPVFLAVSPGAAWSQALRAVRLLSFTIAAPDFEARRQLWVDASAARGRKLSDTALTALADRFVLSPGQIGAALQSAIDLAALDGAGDELPFDALLEGARLQAGGGLGRMAVKVRQLHTWDDLVLPAATMRQVREVADAARNAHIVYYRWQFERRFGEGRGLKVMFSGASGTGKTMTAAVIARDLGIDLYKVDLSGVVSKYIGETEKNLDRVFEAALAANAILFFDEADALFGKRSEVKDAHDRYANIEIAYLLQKMESHAGMVILATNLGKNIDDAFSRRMQYVVEFPLPDETHRERLWRGMFPSAAPLRKDVDFRFLARQFALSGGEIRNAALEAAFLAARNGQVIGMQHLMQSLARQMTKQGRLPSPQVFGKYYEQALE